MLSVAYDGARYWQSVELGRVSETDFVGYAVAKDILIEITPGSFMTRVWHNKFGRVWIRTAAVREVPL